MANENLLPANTTLLQPGTPFFRLVDALQALGTIPETPLAQPVVLAETGLQNQINQILARLRNAGIP